MDPQDIWIGRQLRDRGLVSRDDLVRAAGLVAERARAGQALRLLPALIEVGAIGPEQAAELAAQLTSIAQQAAADAALAASWADMTALPLAPAAENAAPTAESAAPPAAPRSPASSARHKALAASGRRRALSSGRHRGLPRPEGGAPRAPAPSPARVAVVICAVGLLLAGAVALTQRRAADPVEAAHAPAPSTSASAAHTTPGPSPSDRAPVEPPRPLEPPPPDERDVARLESSLRFADALLAVQRALADPRTTQDARVRLQALVPGLEAARALQTELEGALSEGPDAPRLRELIRRVEQGQLDPALQDSPLVEAWRARARTLLGNEEYALVAGGGGVAAVTSSLKGDPRRLARLAEAARAGQTRLEEARRELAARDAAAASRVHREAERALAAVAKVASWMPIPAHRGQPAAQGRLVEWDARGFAVRLSDGRLRRYSWRDAPASTACDVLELGLDPRDPDDAMRIARAAARGGLFPRAKAQVARAEALAPGRHFAPLGELEREARLVHGQGRFDGQACALRYDFSGEEEADDFTQTGFGWQSVQKGGLSLQTFGKGQLSTWHAVAFDQGFELTVKLDPQRSRKGELLLGTWDGVCAVTSAGVRCAREWKDLGPIPRAGRVDPAQPLVLRVTRQGAGQRLDLVQGSTTLVALSIAEASWPTYPILGASGGQVVLDELRVAGHPDPDWLKQAEERRELSLEVMVDALDLMRGMTSRLTALVDELEEGDADAEPSPEQLERMQEALYPLPAALGPTSAEDELCLADVPERARTELALARRWARMRLTSYALRHAREAVALGRRRYWAAEYVVAWLESRSASAHESGTGVAGIRLDQAIGALDGFAEALALRSRLLLRDGRLDEARRDAEAAVEARPDYGPARAALALVLQREDQLEQALTEARLATVLAGDDPELLREERQLEAQREGPSWSEPVTRESEHYTLVTDLPTRADEVLSALEAARRDGPRLFPCLRARPGARLRKSRVLLFARKVDYMRYTYRAMGDPQEDTYGVFDPESGTLHAWEGDRGHDAMLRTIRHEATHQWCHTLGLELPYWANEAIADYVGGWDEQTGHSRAEPHRCQTLLQHEDATASLYELMNMSPSEFYAGESFLHYAQAWSFVHCCLEGGDPRLKETLFAYLDLHTRGQAGDSSRQAGASLERIYVQTFHLLDAKQVQERWQRHTQALAAEAEAGAE